MSAFKKEKKALVGLVMGSASDWATLEKAAQALDIFSVPYDVRIISAHRTPKRLFDYAESAQEEGLMVLIAGAGGAAHLPGMLASLTSLPVLGVPVMTMALQGQDSLYSIVQMPKGVPVGTLAIGENGAFNAGLLAVSILSLADDDLQKKWKLWREKQTADVPLQP